MSKIMPEACPKCGGKSRFYHMSDNPDLGFVKCDECGYKQQTKRNREKAIINWNKLNNLKKKENKGPKRIWDNYEEIAEVRKSDAIKFIVAAATREGFRYINIREFYMRKKDNVWMPGRDGITIPLKSPLNKGEKMLAPAEAMIEALSKAMECAATMELMNEEKAIWLEVKE